MERVTKLENTLEKFQKDSIGKIDQLLKQTTRVGFVDAGEENTDEIVEINDVFFLE